ncbi:BAG family molecular chaperone regulator 5, mitochondrial [Capsicum chinense]|nr:BAG family molecular chaperone regulator 5, mitochondrial [Capsicum chinense]
MKTMTNMFKNGRKTLFIKSMNVTEALANPKDMTKTHSDLVGCASSTTLIIDDSRLDQPIAKESSEVVTESSEASPTVEASSDESTESTEDDTLGDQESVDDPPEIKKKVVKLIVFEGSAENLLSSSSGNAVLGRSYSMVVTVAGVVMQEIVDVERSSKRERIRMNEARMGLLLRLDSVLGVNPTVRELRRDLSRSIVRLQEILDAVSNTKSQNWDRFVMDRDDFGERMEMDVCKERVSGNE